MSIKVKYFFEKLLDNMTLVGFYGYLYKSFQKEIPSEILMRIIGCSSISEYHINSFDKLEFFKDFPILSPYEILDSLGLDEDEFEEKYYADIDSVIEQDYELEMAGSIETWDFNSYVFEVEIDWENYDIYLGLNFIDNIFINEEKFILFCTTYLNKKDLLLLFNKAFERYKLDNYSSSLLNEIKYCVVDLIINSDNLEVFDLPNKDGVDKAIMDFDNGIEALKDKFFERIVAKYRTNSS